MHWGLTGRETARRYPAAPRARVGCVPACPANSPTLHYFPETGHTLANGMLALPGRGMVGCGALATRSPRSSPLARWCSKFSSAHAWSTI